MHHICATNKECKVKIKVTIFKSFLTSLLGAGKIKNFVGVPLVLKRKSTCGLQMLLDVPRVGIEPTNP
jgi:hypothetical protein